MSKEPTKHDVRDERSDQTPPEQGGKPPGDKLEELRQKGEILNVEEGPYHGYTPAQAQRMEEARGDPTPGTDGIVESPNEPPGSDVMAGIPVDESTPQSKEYKQHSGPGTTDEERAAENAKSKTPPKNEEEAADKRGAGSGPAKNEEEAAAKRKAKDDDDDDDKKGKKR